MFATGGLGGVHREAASTFDESADLVTLARTRIAVVCAGVKSILDVRATLERLETLGVTVVGYRTRAFPGFFITDSGRPGLVGRLAGGGRHGTARAAAAGRRRDRHRRRQPAAGFGAAGSGAARRDPGQRSGAAGTGGITGKAVTPFLLAHFHSATGGRSLAVNVRIILRNAALAAQIAAAHAGAPKSSAMS